MGASALSRVQTALVGFLDEDRDEDLALACRLAAEMPLDIAALLDWVQRYRCAPENRTRALRALRSALGLPAIPGPVCRPR